MQCQCAEPHMQSEKRNFFYQEPMPDGIRTQGRGQDNLAVPILAPSSQLLLQTNAINKNCWCTTDTFSALMGIEFSSAVYQPLRR